MNISLVIMSHNWYKLFKSAQVTYDELVKERPNRKLSPEEKSLQDAMEYFSIGQMDEEVIKKSWCWYYDYDIIHAKQGGTHSINFGTWSKDYWRGWYDPDQELISVVRPKEFRNSKRIPLELTLMLREKWGPNPRIIVF